LVSVFRIFSPLLTQNSLDPPFSPLLSLTLSTPPTPLQAMEQRYSALSTQHSKRASENATLASENDKLKEVK
jgi:hypothetical protein